MDAALQLLVRPVGPESLGTCPAAVAYTPGGTTEFQVNVPVLRRYPPAQQRFILAHELGHRLLDTSSEHLADAFALGLTAGRQPRSLKSSVRALATMPTIPAERLAALLRLCLRVDPKPKNNTTTL